MAIHADPRIQGLEMQGKVKKLGLFADDGILALKWAKATFDAVKETLLEFQKVSNLKVNSFKSSIVPLGSTTSPREVLEEEQMFPHILLGRFCYLGTTYSVTDKQIMVESIPEMELQAIKNIVNQRCSSIHTLLGRIVNVKSLMISQFTYKFSCLPSPPTTWFQQVQSFLNKYIWSNNPCMVASLTYQPVSSGGLNMIDLITFDKELKISWLFKAVKNPDSCYALQLQECLPMPVRTFLTLNLKKHISRGLLRNPSLHFGIVF